MSSSSSHAPDASIATTTSTKKSLKYEKMDPITHIHRRTDMYIGNPIVSKHPAEWLWLPGGTKMVRVEEPEYSDGLLRILIEPLSNMIDNLWRSREAGIKCSKFGLGVTKNSIEFWNDGLGIPVEMDGAHGVYIPELIFGHLLTSSNYDDTEDRFASGRNGIGVKLSNVFSKQFEVEIGDSERGLVYLQKWSDHMRTTHKPKISNKKSLKTSYTRIRFEPDISCFGMTLENVEDPIWTPVLQGWIRKVAYDTAALVKLPIHLSLDLGPELESKEVEKIVLKSLKEHVVKHLPVTPSEVLEVRLDLDKNQYVECVVAYLSEEYESVGIQEVGFVNGIYNREGGVHVDAVTQDLFRQLLGKFQKSSTKGSEFPLSAKELKPGFMIWVHANLINPAFTSQNKTKLVAPAPKIVLPGKVIDTVMKWDRFRKRIEEEVRNKQTLSLKKTENKKKGGGVVRIDGLDSANLAGSNRSQECTLILCEGLSAKTYAVLGIQVGWNNWKGRDFFGIYPLRGKLLNCRNASVNMITQNKEITDLIQAMNLRHNVDYRIPENRKQLNYGRILILTDSDVDGLHIASLILNAFHFMFPTLCTLPTSEGMDPFIYWMMTPVAKIYLSGKQPETFYNDFDYQRALSQLSATGSVSNPKIKYFKGLGTCSNSEVSETFGQKVVSFDWDGSSGDSMKKAFLSSHSNDRKKWMEAYEEDAYETPGDTYPITKFIDQELIRYSIDDCMRSLPNLLDGLKQSQRKILYAVFKKNLRQKSMKVAQLSGYVAEVSNYHHGEQCLYDTITKMAHHFVGSNNLPYLVRDGQFGSRSYLGKDAANARYIFTRMDPLCRLIFPDLDDKLLSHTLDDGDRVEPDYYVPVLPMILVNGCSAGIGTGWSCSVPCFHPLRLVDKILGFLDTKTKARDDDEAWIPWYRYFKGTISKKESRKAFTTTGILRGPGTYDLNQLMDKIQDKVQGKDHTKDAKSMMVKKNNEKLEKKCWCIEEIPVKESINRYKEFLEKIQEEKKIKNLKNYSSADSPLFLFEVVAEFQPTIENLKLTSEVSVSNLVLWSEEKKLVKYEGVPEIFYHFCERRIKMYKDRREYLLKTWREKLVRMEAIYRFLREVAGGTLKVFKVPENEILSQLETKGYPLVEGTYEYLLTIRIRQFSKQNWEIHEKRIESLKRSIGIMERVTSSEMWKMDLVPFLKEYKKVYDDVHEEEKTLVQSLIDRIEKQAGFHLQENMLWVPEEEEDNEKEEKMER